jgi:beta-glucanase (GH16 family)
MSPLLKILIPFLLSGAALAIPHPFNEGRAAPSSASSMKSSISSTKASSATTSKPTIRSSTSPNAGSSVPSKSGCLWNVPGVGSFAETSTFSFTGTSLPSGLQVNTYPVENDNAPYFHSYTASNAYVRNGFLNLRVPGGQTQSPITGGEVQTTEGDIFYATVRTRAIFSTVPGTCTGNFFYKDDTQEFDIEYLSDNSSLSNDGAGNPAPIQYTNQATEVGGLPTHDTAPAPTDVSTLHEYRIDWVPGRTSFFLDGVLQRTFTDNLPTQGGFWIWNNWSTGDEGWTKGPPLQDNVYKIKDIVMYYNRTSTTGTC